MPPTNLLQQKIQNAIALLNAGRLSDARPLLSQVRNVKPNCFDGWFLGGAEAYQSKRYGEAIVLLKHAVRLNATHAAANIHLGAALARAGNPKEAESFLRAQSTRFGNVADFWTVLGDIYLQIGDPRKAAEAAAQIVRLQPKSAAAHETLGERLVAVDGVLAGEPHFRKAVQLDPTLACAWTNLGVARADQCHIAEAMGCFDKAKAIDPNWRFAFTGRALALLNSYKPKEAADEYEHWLKRHPNDPEALSARLMTLNYLPGISPEVLATQHRLYGTCFSAPSEPPVFKHDRLRVGFLSPDLKSHSCAWFIGPILQHLDHGRFDVYLYHAHAKTDAVSARLQTYACAWRHVAGLSSGKIAKMIRDDEIDVLVDLAGHSSFNMLEVFAQKPALVQITYLGYPNTTGLGTMNYRFVDAITDPSPTSDSWHSEVLVRFAPTAWAYRPPEDAPPCAHPPSSGGSPFTFASFNNFQKVTAECLHEWARLVHAVPGARLMLKSRGLLTPEINRDVLGRLKVAGLNEEEVVLMDAVPNTADHLALYNRVDVALDTHPYNGTTTTCEALWMGVPVITLEGQRHASRVGTSLLKAINYPEWIARDWDEYRQIGQRLAASPSSLAEIRANLRSKMKASVLLDHTGQAKRFGLALAHCWNQVVAPNNA